MTTLSSASITVSGRAGTSVSVVANDRHFVEVAVSNRGAVPAGGVEMALLTADEANALITALTAAVAAI